jgi:hypothetical protein
LEGSDFDLTELLYRDLPGGTEESNRKSVRIAGIPTEIRNEYLSFTSLECYRHANLLGSRVANIASTSSSSSSSASRWTLINPARLRDYAPIVFLVFQHFFARLADNP